MPARNSLQQFSPHPEVYVLKCGELDFRKHTNGQLLEFSIRWPKSKSVHLLLYLTVFIKF